MNKILIIGQAPPAVKQEFPYDTTLLYEILSWVGISKEQAQTMFEFEAMSDKFPGFSAKKGAGHLKPSGKDMINHWNTTLQAKVQDAEKIIVLGAVAKETLQDYGLNALVVPEQVLFMMHPSTRNTAAIKKNKASIIKQLTDFLNYKI